MGSHERCLGQRQLMVAEQCVCGRWTMDRPRSCRNNHSLRPCSSSLRKGAGSCCCSSSRCWSVERCRSYHDVAAVEYPGNLPWMARPRDFHPHNSEALRCLLGYCDGTILFSGGDCPGPLRQHTVLAGCFAAEGCQLTLH